MMPRTRISSGFLPTSKQQQSSTIRCLQVLLLLCALFTAIDAQFFFNQAPQFSSYDYSQDQSIGDPLSDLFGAQSSSQSQRYYNDEQDENGNIRTGNDLASLFLYCRTCGRGKRSLKSLNRA